MGIKHTKYVDPSSFPNDSSKQVSTTAWNDNHTIDSDVDFASHKAINVLDPTSSQDVATKNYVDTNLTSTAATKQSISSRGILSGFRDKIINGNGRFNQRGATTATDDTYAWDCHNILTQTSSVGVSTLSAVSSGIGSMMRMTQSNATAQRMGFSYIIASPEVYEIRGQTMTIGGKVRYSNTANIRYAVLEWSGTADSPTSDVVNDWTSSTYTNGNFFITTNLTVNTVGVIAVTANTITNFSTAVTLSGAGNNVILFLWTEGTAAQNSTLDLWWWFVEGDATTETRPAPSRPYSIELSLCEQFYEKSYEIGVTPGSVDVAGSDGWVSVNSTVQIGSLKSFKTRKFKVPTIDIYSPDTGTINRVRNISTSADTNYTLVNTSTTKVGYIQFGVAANSGDQWRHHWTARVEL